MNSGTYAACAGLVARMKALDTIASNMANSSSVGFRGEKETFGTVLAEARHHGVLSALNKVTNSYAQLGSIDVDDTQGEITRTGSDLDVAIQGQGYFKVQTQTGVVYTRDGSFRVDVNGNLTTANGDAVLGQTGPITLSPGPVTISADGTISSAGAISGKLAIVTFAPGTNLSNRGMANYTAPTSAERPATGATVEQGALEGSNVSPVEGVVQLISAQRAAESMRHVLSLMDNDMDKTAAQELARVG